MIFGRGVPGRLILACVFACVMFAGAASRARAVVAITQPYPSSFTALASGGGAVYVSYLDHVGAAGHVAATVERFPLIGAPSSVVLGMGTVSETGEIDGSLPVGQMVVDPAGNVWLTDEHAPELVRIDPQGGVTSFPLPAAVGGSVFGDPTIGPGGDVWITNGQSVGSVDASGQVTTYPVLLSRWISAAPGPGNQRYISGLAGDAHGNLWATANGANGGLVLRLSATGQVSGVARIPKMPDGIAVASDGHVWVAVDHQLDEIDPVTLRVRVVPVPYRYGPIVNAGPSMPVQGPDGEVWFVDDYRLGAVSPSGVVSQISLPAGNPADPLLGLAANGQQLWAWGYIPPVGRYETVPEGEVLEEYTAPATSCTVPNLEGDSLRRAERAAHASGCQIAPFTQLRSQKCRRSQRRVATQIPAARSPQLGQADIAITMGCPKRD